MLQLRHWRAALQVTRSVRIRSLWQPATARSALRLHHLPKLHLDSVHLKIHEAAARPAQALEDLALGPCDVLCLLRGAAPAFHQSLRKAQSQQAELQRTKKLLRPSYEEALCACIHARTSIACNLATRVPHQFEERGPARLPQTVPLETTRWNVYEWCSPMQQLSISLCRWFVLVWNTWVSHTS